MKYILLSGLIIASGMARAAALTPEERRRNSHLCQYAETGNLTEIQRLLAAGADVHTHSQEFFGKTPLHLASSHGHNEVVTALLAAGAPVNATDDHGSTPLHCATKKEVAEQLLAAGADVHTQTKQWFTPLHCASEMGQAEVIKLLLAKNAAVDARNLKDETPLYRASLQGNTNVIEPLVAAGADINARTKEALTPLHIASKHGFEPAVGALLAAGADIDAQDIHGNTALSLASKFAKNALLYPTGHTLIVNRLLALKAQQLEAQKQQQLEAMPAYEWQTAKHERSEIKGASLATPSAKRQR
jgi:ankyrin repeat protein